MRRPSECLPCGGPSRVGGFIVCSPCNLCPPHVYCAFSVGKVKKKKTAVQELQNQEQEWREDRCRHASACSCPARLSKRPKRKVNPFALQSRQISKNRRPPIKQTMKRNGGGKGEATCMLWLLCVHVDISTVYLMRGADAGAGGFQAVRRGDAVFWRTPEFRQKRQHDLIPKTMLTWI